MAEEVTETQQPTEEVETIIETKEKPPKPNNTGLWLSLFLLLLILLFAGAGFYIYQQLNDKLIAQSAKMSTEDERVIELTKQITAFQSQFANLQEQLANASAEATGSDASYNQRLSDFSKRYDEKLAAQDEKHQEDLLRIQRQLGKTRGDLLLADAEYLLSVANQRLHLMGDLRTTEEALVAADQRLRESGDGAAFKIREQIAKEIAAVKAVQMSDIVGSYSTLQLLIERIEKLALILPYPGKPLTKSEQIHSHESNSEHDLLDSALKQVEGYVTVRHLDQPVKEVLTDQQVAFIREQLSVKLEMIKIALVQKNTTLYAKTIDDAIAWLDEHFVKNNDAQDFIAQLNKLKSTSIYSELPDISLSLKMLRDVTKLRIETDKALLKTELEAKTSKQPETKTNTITPKTETTSKEAVVSEKEPNTETTQTGDENVAKEVAADNETVESQPNND